MAQPTEVLFLLLVSAVTLASGRVLRDPAVTVQNFTCGLRPVEPSFMGERIVNGHTPKYGSYPWQAGIFVFKKGVWRFHCGGIIIDDDWVLSAAHCFEEFPAQMVKVYVGDHYHYRMDPSEQSFNVQRLFVHEQYGKPPYDDNDIALLKLQPNNGKVIRFDYNVQPACLPAPDTPYTAGKTCLISGWGLTDPIGNVSTVLQAAKVPLLSLSQCKEAMNKHKNGQKLTLNMVCAGPVDPYGGICTGDSGGPLVSKEDVGYTVLGITSWGPGYCGTKGDPVVFVKVNQFLPWIQKKMQT